MCFIVFIFVWMKNPLKTIFFLFVILYAYNSVSQEIKKGVADFYHLKPNGSLTQNSISFIAQDSIGQMWFATKNGVVKYNGKEFRVFLNIINDSNSIQDNFTNCILVTHNGDVWVGTGKGANRYNPEKDCFEPFINKKFENATINSIAEDKNGVLYFLDIAGNLFRFNPANKKFETFNYNSGEQGFGFQTMYITSGNRIFITTNKTFILEFIPKTGLFKKINLFNDDEIKNLKRIKFYAGRLTETHDGKLWISTNYGFFFVYDLRNGNITRFYFKKDLSPKGYLYVMAVKEDKDNNIWFGTWFDGLYKISADRKTITHFMPDRDNKNSLSNTIVESIFQDNAGYMWFGTEFSGINILKKNKKFFTIAGNTLHNDLPSLPFTCSVKDTSGKIWLGTDMGGLLWFYKDDLSNIHKFNFNTKDKVQRIFSLLYSKDKKIWIGTEKGLFCYNPANGNIVHYEHKKDDFNTLSGNNIISLCEDKQGNIWAGTIFRGLNKIDIKNNKVYRIQHSEDAINGLADNYISSIACDNRNNIWIGTNKGLSKLNTATGSFTTFKANPDLANTISSDRINCLKIINGNLWIGTEGGGIDKYNFASKKFENITTADGLPSNDIEGINIDDKNNLWVSTTHNISKINLKDHNIVNYGKSDGIENTVYVRDYGLQELEFYENFANKDEKGFMYFGGMGGMFIFHPDSLPQNNYKPPVIIEKFTVNGKPVQIKNNKVVLNPGQNHIKITLTVLNFIQPDKNKQAYYLQNYDTAWHYTANSRDISYFLPSGEYKFYYKGANNDGVWSKNYLPLTIIILPEFYQTAWFKALIISLVAFIFVLFLAYRYYLYKRMIKKKELLRYSNSNLSEELINQINDNAISVLENQKLFLEADLSLQKLAKEINTKPNYLSQVINTKHNCNFREFINKYRIDFAKKLLSGTNLKIEAVAYDSGFNNISTFNLAFKKETGMTPSQYRKSTLKQ